ncbi:MAG: hypothetical protein IJS13_06735 [Paludibacteraceae bacterium]|nr:hypothetical protein [Paludibacteraceae bacterium]
MANLTKLFTYNSVKECENTLSLAYAIKEVLTSASFKDDKRVRAAITMRELDREIAAAEEYWTANGGGANLVF